MEFPNVQCFLLQKNVNITNFRIKHIKQKNQGSPQFLIGREGGIRSALGGIILQKVVVGF